MDSIMNSMTVKEMKEYLRENGILFTGLTLKADLAEIIYRSRKLKKQKRHELVPGGLSNEIPADKTVLEVIKHVASEIREKLELDEKSALKVVSYVSQVVAGQNFLVKLFIPQLNNYVHAAIYCNLRKETILMGLELNKSKTDKIQSIPLNTSILHVTVQTLDGKQQYIVVPKVISVKQLRELLSEKYKFPIQSKIVIRSQLLTAEDSVYETLHDGPILYYISSTD